MIKQYFLFAIFFVLSINSYANEDQSQRFCSEKEIIFSGFTKHFKNNGKYAQEFGYNEKNAGIGFACSTDNIKSWNESLEVGIARNSYRKDSLYFAYNILYPLTPKAEIGVKLVAANGYKQLDLSQNGWFAGPLLTSKFHITEDININLSLLPTIKSRNASGFVWLTIGYQFH